MLSVAIVQMLMWYSIEVVYTMKLILIFKVRPATWFTHVTALLYTTVNDHDMYLIYYNVPTLLTYSNVNCYNELIAMIHNYMTLYRLSALLSILYSRKED